LGSVPHYFETALYEMKEIAEYVAGNQLNLYERNKLNDEMNQLKDEVASLEKQLVPSPISSYSLNQTSITNSRNMNMTSFSRCIMS